MESVGWPGQPTPNRNSLISCTKGAQHERHYYRHWQYGQGDRLLDSLKVGIRSPLWEPTRRTQTRLLANFVRSRHPTPASKSAVTKKGIKGDIVILALWYPVNLSVAEQFKEQLAGKVVIDIANPLNETFDGIATQPGSSSAEELAQALPESKIIKAFNTTFAGTLADGEVAGQPLDVFIAGDNAER